MPDQPTSDQPISDQPTSHERTLEVSDPLRLRALAHPLRLLLLRLLREHQPVTGARLAELTGESTASVSYHLSVLHKHGFIEPDPAPGPTRRHKPWRTTYERLRIVSDNSAGPPSETVEGAILASMLSDTRRTQDAYFRGASGLADGWQDVGTFEMTDLVLTEPEFDELTERVEAVLTSYRTPTGTGPSARFSVSFIAIPTLALPPTEDDRTTS
jgi:DNA-binding transcriptional ArsR family regulator